MITRALLSTSAAAILLSILAAGVPAGTGSGRWAGSEAGGRGVDPVVSKGAGEAGQAGADGEKADDEKLTLERIFPEKSFFGPSAGSASFSRDGRYCAFLYRPWLERRHGSDLYIYDTRTGRTRRITSVGRMAEFQADVREVRDDRAEKAKKAGVTLTQLAHEQALAMGWSDGAPVGDWSGEATADDGADSVRPGECELSLSAGADGAISGELRIGLVRLPVSEGEFDRAAHTLKATVADEKLGVRGDLTLTRDGDELAGELVLGEPAASLALSLERDEEPEGGDEDRTPRGVIDAVGERLTLGDVVLVDDAEINDEKDGKKPEKEAPRYGGVQNYEWSPEGNEMLVLAGGDLYRLVIDEEKWAAPIERPEPEAEEPPAKDGDAADGEGAGDDEGDGDADEDGEENGDAETEGRESEDGDEGAGEQGDDASDDEADDAGSGEARKTERPELRPVEPYRGDLTRLTRTREREADVQYLPDGAGYTYLREGALLMVTFGDHRIVQLDPELKDGERMVGYRISPDRKRLVFLANRGDNFWGAGRQVTIVNYRDRFARAEQVTRHMPDDPWPEAFSSVYLYDLGGHETEEGTLERVFTKRITGPRDTLRVPEWSPDSSRVAFAAYEQKTGLVKVLEAGFVDEKAEGEAEKSGAAGAEEDAADELGRDEQEGDKDDQDEEEEDEQEEEQEEEDQKEEEREQDGGRRDGGGEQDGRRGAKAGEDAGDKDEEKPEFKIENARVVYEFFHFGGPNTPGMVVPWYLPDSRRMIFITELSGFRQLHLLDPRYQQLRQLTEGQFEVYPFHLSEDHTTLFVTATDGDPNQEHVLAIDTESGEARRLTPGQGVYSSAAVSDDGGRLLANRVDFGALMELVAITAGEEPVVLTESHPEEAHKLTGASPEYFSYENRHGQVIHGHMFKPEGWTAQDKRPLLIYVYGGPLGERKMATRGSFAAPSYFFARYMTEAHGWVTATIDPRGASGYGAVFEKANFEQVGKPQTEDLVDGARWLVEHAGVDEERMSLHGWSFGGFQTQMVMYTEPDVFAAGIAGAGPTEWHNYNSWYSTGTIGSSEPGKIDLEKYSLLPLAKNLKGKLLLVHGMEDSNVLYQDTVRVYRELLKADKEVNVELFLDPTGGHGLGGDVKTLGRYRKYEDFLLRCLGEGEASKPEPAGPPEEAEAAAAEAGVETERETGDDDGDGDGDGGEDD